MLANEPAPAQPKARPERSAYSSTQLHGDARILQALNRFTFGPEPGELEAVRAEGLDKWFNEQLHPKSIDESKLYTRLAQFPAMQMSLQDLDFPLSEQRPRAHGNEGHGAFPAIPCARDLRKSDLPHSPQAAGTGE